MKYKLIQTDLLPNSVEVNTPETGSATFQANITFEILPEIEGHEIPSQYKTQTLTFNGLVFDSLDMAEILADKENRGLDKLKEIFGDSNVIA